MAVLFTKLTTKKSIVLTSKIDQLIGVIVKFSVIGRLVLFNLFSLNYIGLKLIPPLLCAILKPGFLIIKNIIDQKSLSNSTRKA